MPMVVKYANAYYTDRAYGGPEEGGWWYDVGEPIMSLPFLADESETVGEDGHTQFTFDNLSRNLAYEKLYELCHAAGLGVPDREWFQRRDWSMEHIKFYIEDKAGEFFPQERPRYE